MEIIKNPAETSERAAFFIAISLTFIWLVGLSAILILYPSVLNQVISDQSLTALLLVGFFLPLALIWAAALIARSFAMMRAETKALRISVEKMRQTLQVQVVDESEMRDHWIHSQLAQIAALTKQTDNHISALTKRTQPTAKDIPALRNALALPQEVETTQDDNQAALPLPTNSHNAPSQLTIRDFIKALNFPDNADDTDGFSVLRRAFTDRTVAQLLQNAQDVLTMLSQDGIYMDDLRVDPPAASAWRDYANGERGQAVSALSLVRDRTALTLTKTRLRNDIIFRETTHRFLTRYANILTTFEKTAQDQELFALGETRTAMAFMLLGRVSGAFEAV
ncbi:MAG: hypothetical protein COB84_03880 [Rhodobacteraceae bacterium]|nr:MAG: hypothetical protein COB84_03880 [Paracoccaceae bacterium]